MKNKGFTLVELLAVIVVLAIISIITIPVIGNVIEESKKKALEVSANGLVEAANYFTISNDGVYEFVFDENKKGETIKGESLDYKGSIEGTGKLYIDKNGDISLCLVDDKYYVYKNYNSGIYVGEVKDNSCIIGYDLLTNKYIAMLDDGTGQVSNVYSKEEVNNLIDSVSINVANNTNEITDIKESINTIATVVNNNTNTTTTNTNEISNIKENINTLTATVDNNTNIITTNTNEISNIKGAIETLQNSLNSYALQSSLNETNNNLNNLSSVVASNTNNINSLQTSISDINNNLNGKQPTITGGATTIATSNLTTSRALVSNSSGKVSVSAVTSTELGYLDGVTSNIQTQINNLDNKRGWTLLGSLTGKGSSSNQLTLPTGYKELLVVSTATSVNNMTIHIPPVPGYYSGSYYVTDTDNAFYRIRITSTAVYLMSAYTNGGTDVTSSTSISVYYR